MWREPHSRHALARLHGGELPQIISRASIARLLVSVDDELKQEARIAKEGDAARSGWWDQWRAVLFGIAAPSIFEVLMLCIALLLLWQSSRLSASRGLAWARARGDRHQAALRIGLAMMRRHGVRRSSQAAELQRTNSKLLEELSALREGQPPQGRREDGRRRRTIVAGGGGGGLKQRGGDNGVSTSRVSSPDEPGMWSEDDEDEEEDGDENDEPHPLLAALVPARLISRMRAYYAREVTGADRRARVTDLLDRALRRSRMSH